MQRAPCRGFGVNMRGRGPTCTAISLIIPPAIWYILRGGLAGERRRLRPGWASRRGIRARGSTGTCAAFRIEPTSTVTNGLDGCWVAERADDVADGPHRLRGRAIRSGRTWMAPAMQQRGGPILAETIRSTPRNTAWLICCKSASVDGVADEPRSDPFEGRFQEDGELLRLDLLIDGLVNPPGSTDPVAFDPFRYGDHPLFGFIEIDVDEDVETGGEIDHPEHRYLGNITRFGGKPSRGGLC